VPTIRFQVLYVFLLLAHERRRVVHFNVTAHPTAEWTAQQLREAFPFDQIPRYLLRDRDKIFGDDFRRHEDSGGSVGPAVTLAASLRRARDWLHSARMPGSCDCFQRNRSAPNAISLFFLLSRNPASPFLGKGLARAPESSAAGAGPSSGGTPSRGTASSVRAVRRLKRYLFNPPPIRSSDQCG